MKQLSKHRRVHLTVALTALAVTVAGRELYRPWIYSRGIDDFFVADTMGHSFSTVAAAFLLLAVAGRGARVDYPLILIATAALVFYELIEVQMGGVIDPHDIVAALVAGAFSAMLYRWIHGARIRLATADDDTGPHGLTKRRAS